MSWTRILTCFKGENVWKRTMNRVLFLKKKKLISYLKVNELQIRHQGAQEPAVVQLLSELRHCFRLRLLLICAVENFFHGNQIFGNFFCSLILGGGEKQFILTNICNTSTSVKHFLFVLHSHSPTSMYKAQR